MLSSASNSVVLLLDMLTCVICTYHPEVYAAREKNGVYIPKDRYYQEESEKKVLDWSCLSFTVEQFFTFLFLYSSGIDLLTVEDSYTANPTRLLSTSLYFCCLLELSVKQLGCVTCTFLLLSTWIE